jgi:hypothetical protein
MATFVKKKGARGVRGRRGVIKKRLPGREAEAALLV